MQGLECNRVSGLSACGLRALGMKGCRGLGLGGSLCLFGEAKGMQSTR